MSGAQKKMTLKEFKTALDACGHTFEVFGWEGILNTIAIAKASLMDDIKKRIPDSILVEKYTEEIDAIDRILRNRGYY